MTSRILGWGGAALVLGLTILFVVDGSGQTRLHALKTLAAVAAVETAAGLGLAIGFFVALIYWGKRSPAAQLIPIKMVE